eukprot:g8180.t1
MDSAHEQAIAAAVAAVEAAADAPTAVQAPAAPAPAAPAPAAAPAAYNSDEGDGPSNEMVAMEAALDAYRASLSAAPASTPAAAAAFTAAAAAAGLSLGITTNGKSTGPKTASGPKRKRLLRLQGGDLVVIPTNIYRQAGGLKLDITLGGFRIDGEKCTLKNRAYNFGVLPGFTRENLLALSAFRDTLLPTDRSTVTSIHRIIAAEAITRYDEEHQKPPETSSLESSYYGVGGWIPDSRIIHMTFAGSNMELKVKAGDLRAIDRPLECKLALEALKADPTVLQGQLDPVPVSVEVYGSDGGNAVGSEPGSTGFVRAAEAGPSAVSGYRSGPKASVGGRGARASLGGSQTELSLLFGGAAGGRLGDSAGGEDVDDLELDSKRGRAGKWGEGPVKKKKKKKTVVVSVAAEDGGEGGGDAVECELPLHVQCVEGKQCSPSLRLKVPLTGFLVNGEEAPESELMVANGLDVTKENLLALRACRDAVVANFAGPDLVKRVVAGEVFRVWNKRRGGSVWASGTADVASAATTSTAAAASTAAATAATTSTDLPGVDVLTLTPISSESLLVPLGGEAEAEISLVQNQQQQQQQQQTANEQSTQGAEVTTAAEGAALEGGGTLLSTTEEADYTAVDADSSEAARSSQPVANPATTRASAAAARAAVAAAGGLAVRPPAFAMDDIVTLSSPASFPGAPRIEMRMTVGELKKARQTRLAELKRLVVAMLQDPKVQAGELQVRDDDMGSPAITQNNLSGAAAAAAAAGVAAMVNRANSHTVALLASGQENRGLPSRGITSTAGGHRVIGSLDVGSKVAEKWGATLLQRGKLARISGGVDVNGGGGGGGDWVIDPSSGAIIAAPVGGGVSAIPAAAASTQRRQLWALAIRENELLFEREKEAARKEYDARQQELLRWMIDEEAGRHDALGGDAGPPPPQALVD